MADTVHQGNSHAMPPTTPPRSAFTVVFTPEEEEILKREVSRLHSYSIVCRIIGLRPNRGDLRDLLQAAFQHRIGKIVDVQFLGHAFYHLELDTAESVVVMLNANTINIRNAIACFMPWKPGFDPVEMLNSGHRLTPISVVFPRIPKEYMAVLPSIAARIGTILPPREETIGMKLTGYPSIRILVSSIENLPTQVLLPSLTGNSTFMQKLEYIGMPGQCFYCKQQGHVLKDCPKKKNGVRPQNGTNNVYTDVNHVNLDKKQQSHLGGGSGKGKNVQPSKDEKGKNIQTFEDEIWKPIEKRHSIPNKCIESKGAHVSIGRYDAIQELDNSLSQNDVQICQISNVSEQSTPNREGTESVNNLVMATQSKTMESSKQHLNLSNVSRNLHRSTKRSSSLRGLNANFIRTIPINSQVESTSDFAINRWNATYGFEFLKFLGDIVDNGSASIRVHVLFKTMQSFVGFSFPFCGYDKQTWVAADVRLVIRQQTLHFAKYVNCDNFGEVLLRGLEAATIQLLPVSDVMGRRQVVVSLDAEILPNCGYTYIHEDGLSEGQILAKAHHHYRMVRDTIPLQSKSGEQDGSEANLEPLAKNMKMASQQPKFP